MRTRWDWCRAVAAREWIARGGRWFSSVGNHVRQIVELLEVVVLNCVVHKKDQACLERGFDAGLILIVVTENVFQHGIRERLESRLDLSPPLRYVVVHLFR